MTDETRSEQSGNEPGTEVAEIPTEEGQEGHGKEEEERPKLPQTVEMTDIGPCKKHIKVTLERKAIEDRLEKKFSELVTDANVKGFRPGKAPRKIIERQYQKEVGDQVKAELLLESLEQLAEDHDVAPLSAPNIDPFAIVLPKEGPLVYEFDVEVRPEFDLPNYKGLKLKRPTRTFTDQDVAGEERRLLTPYGQIVPKPEGSAQVGDIIVADVTTRIGDRTLSEIKEFTARVEKQLAFKDGIAPKFADEIQGASAGDKRTVEIELSSAAADEAVRGKTVQASFEIKDVKTVRLPELTHDFLHNFGVHTPEQLHELIRVFLERRLEYQQRQSAREQVLAQIASAAGWQLPQDLLMRQARRALNRRLLEMQAQGMSEEEIRGRVRILEQDVLRSTEASLKEHFVLQKIAELEKIDVEEDDLDQEIERIAEQNNESPRRLRARLERDDLMDALAAELIERRALDLILDNAEYEDLPMGGEEAAAPVSTVEDQMVPGEMQDLTKAPAEETPPAAEEQANQ